MTVAAQRTMSVEEYLSLDHDEHRHTELVEGALVEMNAPHGRHQRMAARLLLALVAAAPAGHEVLLEWGWVTVPGRTVREPDLMVVRSDLVDAAVLEEPPLLLVEVLSPDSGVRDLLDKREEYAGAGLERYLVASPGPAPTLVYYERAGQRLVERAFVAGAEALALPEPFDPAVALVPAELTRPG